MAKDMLLMMKDEPVMAVDFESVHFNIINPHLLPFFLKNRIFQSTSFDEIRTKEDYLKSYKIDSRSLELLYVYLGNRVIPLDRTNAKWIYNLYNFPQLNDEYNKSNIALYCKAVSLQDNYWIKEKDEKLTWKDVNLRNNQISKEAAQIALLGTGDSLSEIKRSPELTTHGYYAKAWIREPDGLYLHKLGAPVQGEDGYLPGTLESKIEVMVSNLLDACNVTHLKYEPGSSTNPRTGEAVYTCKCKCMTTDDISILSGMDFVTWCNVQGIDPCKKALEIDPDSIYKMWIVDYLISNRDRHGLNWGFFYNCNTMEILGCHPLYDHNNAFDTGFMQNKDMPYLYDQRMTMRQAAKEAMQHVDFHFTREITRADFLTTRQYESFTERAKELGIRVVQKEPTQESSQEEIERE